MEHAIANDTLDRFAHSQASQQEKQAVIAHLLQGCHSARTACGTGPHGRARRPATTPPCWTASR